MGGRGEQAHRYDGENPQGVASRSVLDVDHHALQGNIFAALRQSLRRDELQPAAAGHLHAHYRDAADIIVAQDLRQLRMYARPSSSFGQPTAIA